MNTTIPKHNNLVRNQALARYYDSPSICENCDKVIQVPDGGDISQTRRKRFCNQRCVALFSHREGSLKDHARPVKGCTHCGVQHKKKSTYCSRSCRVLSTPKKVNSQRVESKGEIFSGRSWQSARSIIQKNARALFFKANPVPSCAVCHYINHVEIAHRIAVSEFQADALLSEINDLSNLISLCPNHHWEFDRGILKL